MSLGAGYLRLPKYSFGVKYGYRARVVGKRLYKSILYDKLWSVGDAR